ncbi:diguanylate cyclase [Ensifer soli]|uniref:diguanylate cyclase n=1 Tax=Ciceribacter sp. sgz301302 TaxID=3342379 RepID=UPI0035BAE895
MLGDWQGLVTNLAVLAATLMLWTIVQDNVTLSIGRLRPYVFGVIAGGGAMVLMSVPLALAPGVYLDCRVAMVANAGLFGGPVSAMVAAVFALGYRLYLGGAGVVVGSASIALAMLVGVAGYHMVRGRGLGLAALLLFSLAVAVVAVGVSLTLTPEVRALMFPDAAVPFGVLVFIATLMTSLVLRHDQRRRDLIETNRLYRTTIEALPYSLNIKDLDGRFLAANPGTVALMRSGSVDALIGKTDADFYPPEIARQFMEDEKRVLEAGVIEGLDQFVAFPDGSTGWVSTLKVPLRDSAGRLVGLITHNRDITAEKQLRCDLDATRERLNDAMDMMTDGLAIYDGNGILIFCNNRYRELFPRTADLRVPGARYVDILRAGVARGEALVDPGHQLEDWIARHYRMLLAGDNHGVQLADGRWLQIRTAPVKEGILFVLTDVTEQRQAVEELKAAEAEYRALFENAVVGIYRSTPDGQVLRANPALVELNGYDSESALVEAVRDIAGESYVDPRRRDEFSMLMERDGGVVDFVSEIYRHRTRERIWISETAWAVFDANHKVRWYEGTIIDVTERKHAGDRLADANRKLEELAAIDGLTGLSNRRVFDETLEIEFARRGRDGSCLSLVLVDVDCFKAYNDSYGHLAGDDCLRFISQVFRTIVRRPADLACRYGGEELVAILPDTDAQSAHALAEAFRAAVKGLRIEHRASDIGTVSISAGVATCDGENGIVTAGELMQQADRALYGAKAAGRDRVAEAIAA